MTGSRDFDFPIGAIGLYYLDTNKFSEKATAVEEIAPVSGNRIPCLEEMIRLLNHERKSPAEAKALALEEFQQCYEENVTCPMRGSDCFIRNVLQEGREKEIDKMVDLMASSLTDGKI